MKKSKPLHQFELSKLQNSTSPVILDKTLSEGFAPIKNATEKIDNREVQKVLSGTDFTQQLAAKRAALQAAKSGGSKLLGAIPFLGAGYAALQGDPAMAAEQLVGDVPVVGQAYEALRPESAGNPEEERQMLAERNAQIDYDNSPARLARIKALQKIGN